MALTQAIYTAGEICDASAARLIAELNHSRQVGRKDKAENLIVTAREVVRKGRRGISTYPQVDEGLETLVNANWAVAIGKRTFRVNPAVLDMAPS